MALDLDPNDPINILLRPFDPMPNAALSSMMAADANAQALADAQASQAAQAAQAAREAEEAERQRKLAEEKANMLRSQTVGGKNNATIFGGAEGEVVYESNVRPSGRQWQSVNRVETKRTVVDFKLAEPLPPGEILSEHAPSVLSTTNNLRGSASPTFSQPIIVQMAAPVNAAAAAPSPVNAAVTRASPAPKAKPAPRAVPVQVAEGAPSVFSPTAGVHPTTAAAGANKTEEFMKKVGGNSKVRQCPSFRMLEFQIQYEDYKQTKTAAT